MRDNPELPLKSRKQEGPRENIITHEKLGGKKKALTRKKAGIMYLIAA